MPNRILHERICTSETLAGLEPAEEVFFYRLLVQCDDYGRFDGRPMVIRARCYALQLDRVTDADVAGWLDAIERAGLIRRYAVDGRVYLCVQTWERYQQTRAKHSKYPPPPASDSNGNHLLADASNGAHMSPYPVAYPEAIAISGSDSEGAKSAAVAAPTRQAVPKKPTGPHLGPLVDAFGAVGLATPSFERGEGKAAQSLLARYPPEEIAACWQDYASGEYGNDYSKREVSFAFLAGGQRVANWQRWKALPATARAPNGHYRPGRAPGAKQESSTAELIVDSRRNNIAVDSDEELADRPELLAEVKRLEASGWRR
jgi:hypothetical protein